MRPDDVLISAFLDGEVPEQFRAEIEASIESDSVCNARFKRLTRLRATLHRHDVPELESRMTESLASIHRRVAVIPRFGVGPRWRQIQVPLPAIAAAAFVVVVLAAVLVWSFLPKPPASAPDYLAQGQDVDVTIRVDDADMERVLQWLADKEMLGEISIQLPERQFQIVGEPVLLKPARLPGDAR
ncbi:MAG: hypothetical protein KAU31_15715 [Spirochaetaceae bacterium]|nr:hypothetical protein [Spirochaetaceae bacterium]